MIKAIETQYKGYRFRSRLEARWAVFFDALGMRWRYESEGFDCNGIWYLPDFYLPDWDIYLEIKPDLPMDDFGDGFVSLTDGDKLSPIGKFVAAWRSLTKIRRELGQPLGNAVNHLVGRKKGSTHVQPGLYMLCGVPGLPALELRNDRWQLRDGSVAVGFHEDRGEIGFPILAFAKTGGGLDIWPFYLSGEVKDLEEEDLGNVKHSAILPGQRMMHFYIGNGVSYKAPELIKAYRAARSARFEHGETPR